jgi:hypothetical protein
MVFDIRHELGPSLMRSASRFSSSGVGKLLGVRIKVHRNPRKGDR